MRLDGSDLRRGLLMYGVQATQLLPGQAGYRNHSYAFADGSGRWLNLIVYKIEPGMAERIQRINALGSYLAAHGLPLRQPADKRILQLQSRRGKAYASLYEYLPGQTISWETYGKNHIKLAGKALGVMHGRLCNYHCNIAMPNALCELEALLIQMQAYYARDDVGAALETKLKLRISASRLAGLDRLLAGVRQLRPSQPLHLDFVRGNILFSAAPTSNALYLGEAMEGPYISGILDLEKAAVGPPVLDVARTLAFLLVDCKYKLPAKTVKYFVQSGYQKRGGQPLDHQQLRLLRPLSRFFLIHDFYKFLRHNPYEALAANEHYVRTRDILLKDGIIEAT